MRVGGAGLAEPVTLPIESNATYAAGHLVFRQSQTLVARPFDPRSLEFTGPPTPLAEDVAFNPGNGRTAFDASDTLLVYRGEPPRKLTWRDRSGASLGSIGEGAAIGIPTSRPTDPCASRSIGTRSAGAQSTSGSSTRRAERVRSPAARARCFRRGRQTVCGWRISPWGSIGFN